jgi:hypothetical protein
MFYPVEYRRYRLSRQRDGRILAFDQVWPATRLELTPFRASDGDYALALSGDISVRGGRLAGVTAPARASGYEIEAIAGGIFRFRKTREPQWHFALSPHGAVPPSGFAVLDLRDRNLLLVDGQGVRSLRVAPLLPGAVTTPPPSAKGQPDFELSDDFAP